MSQCNPLALLPSGQPQEVKVKTVSDLPSAEGWAHMRRKLQEVAKKTGEWAGVPLPSSYSRLIMEKRYPFQGLQGMKFEDDGVRHNDDAKIINSWRIPSRNVEVVIIEEKNGERWKAFIGNGGAQRQDYILSTLGIASEEIWSVEAETEAMAKLKELVTRQAYKCYFLSGTFLETSKRSGVTYLFRKLRPTIAMRPNKRGTMSIITALCLHPLGYYDKTFAGVQVPTDDVITHLMMMRVDEHKFWAKANHHCPLDASSGI